MNDGGDASKQELKDRLMAGMEYFNGDPHHLNDGNFRISGGGALLERGRDCPPPVRSSPRLENARPA
jgi:hypothetical protein